MNSSYIILRQDMSSSLDASLLEHLCNFIILYPVTFPPGPARLSFSCGRKQVEGPAFVDLVRGTE